MDRLHNCTEPALAQCLQYLKVVNSRGSVGEIGDVVGNSLLSHGRYALRFIALGGKRRKIESIFVGISGSLVKKLGLFIRSIDQGIFFVKADAWT